MVERLDELTDAMTALTGHLDSAPDVGDLLHAVCVEAVRVVPQADMASVTVIRDRKPETTAYTDKRALQVDQAQYRAGDGPCLRAAANGEVVRVSVATAHELWPPFVESAKELGVRSFLAAPLHVDERLIGAINLFGFAEHGYQDLDEQVLRLYSLVAESSMRLLRRWQEANQLAVQLDAAMRNRAVIEQAKGMLMAIHTIDENAAMARLITESQNTNVKLRDVATGFVRKMTNAAGGPG
ncbi:ANTAR domain-containing protein [Amycolatopsis sp. cg5]|uniref:ANTAR domain-containing protein n=1 Tax=Amycolatopsis sp. cg5 TaxID=3238802 RepID=UPI003525B73B